VAIAVEQMLANRRFTPLLILHVHDFIPSSGKNFIEVIRRAMELLRSHDEIHVGESIN
jgi:hypothetical protein